MKISVSILFLFLSTILVSGQSVTVTGKVLNSANDAVLPFAHIMFENFGMGTSSNKEGEFGFSVPDSLKNENIIVSYVGFYKTTIAINDLQQRKVVRLKPKTEALTEVSISSILNDKKYTYRPEQRYETVGIGNMNAALFPSTISRFYPKPEKFPEECFLEYVQIYFFPVEEQKDLSPKFRLHIYDLKENGEPGEDLLEDMVLEKLPGKSSLKVSLLDKKIQVPENGFYIGLEHLFIKENEYIEVKDFYINDSLVAEKFQYKRYAPVYRGIFADPEDNFKVFYYSSEGWVNISNWDVASRESGKDYVVPVFKVRITD